MSIASFFQTLTVRSDAFLPDLDDAVVLNGDGHAVLDIAQKFVAKLVNDGHFRVRPYAAEYCARRGERADGLRRDRIENLQMGVM